MRDYQLAGLNWLIRLYENGINGILADEMVCMEFVPLELPAFSNFSQYVESADFSSYAQTNMNLCCDSINDFCL